MGLLQEQHLQVSLDALILTTQFQPFSSGPLTLSAIYCSQLRQSGFPQSPPLLSPDGKSFFSFDSMNGLSLERWVMDRPSYNFRGA
jgi:hypothetical protein